MAVFRSLFLAGRRFEYCSKATLSRIPSLSHNLKSPKYDLACCRPISLIRSTNISYRASTSFSRSLSQETRVYPENEEEEDILYRKLIVEVQGHDPEVLKSYETFVRMASEQLDVDLVNVETPGKKFERLTLLKSVHIFKKHKVQYEMRTHFKIFNMKHITGSTADTFLEYIQRNLPEGVAMKVTKHRLGRLPSHITPPNLQTSEKEAGS